MLEARDLSVHYGAVRALFGVDLHVEAGEIVAMVGPNGAGKTTVLNAIAGLLPREGEVLFEGQPLSGDPVTVVSSGISLVPQGRKVFPSMTVEENLLLGSLPRGGTWRGAAERFEVIYEYFPKLRDRARQPAGKLSGGEQQMLVIGRALLSEPKLMMIDELSLGLAPKIVASLFDMIVHLNQELGMTFLLVEQAAQAVLAFSSRAYLLQKGRVAYAGEAQGLMDEVDVLRSAYLGASPTAQSLKG